MSQVKQAKATYLDKFEVFLNTCNQGLIAITTFYLMWYCYQSGSMWSKISQHAWITTLGYQLLMAEGIMTYYKANSLTALSSRREKNHIHWILQAVGGAMALYGCAIYIAERERLGRRHFRGNHALWGKS
jgi:cytochrome b-561 domain-containing protein 2